MLRRIIGLFIGVIVAWCAVTGTAHADTTVPTPPQNGYVRDDTATLSSDEQGKLNAKIVDYRKRTSVQLAVLMIPSLPNGQYLEGYSLNVARTWGIGEKAKNNGVLLLIVKNEHKLRIEVGTGLEGDLTDVRSSRIIRDRIAPEFRKNNYYQGIYSGLEGITLAIGGSQDALLSNDSQSTSSGGIESIIEMAAFGIVMFVAWFGSILGRTKSWWAGGIVGALFGGIGTFFFSGGSVVLTVILAIIAAILGLFFDFVVSKNYRAAVSSGGTPSWWAGGGSFGGGGGGSSFGGGGFGGGGSSGSW